MNILQKNSDYELMGGPWNFSLEVEALNFAQFGGSQRGDVLTDGIAHGIEHFLEEAFAAAA